MAEKPVTGFDHRLRRLEGWGYGPDDATDGRQRAALAAGLTRFAWHLQASGHVPTEHDSRVQHAVWSALLYADPAAEDRLGPRFWAKIGTVIRLDLDTQARAEEQP